MHWVFRLLKRSEITPDLKNKEARCARLALHLSACCRALHACTCATWSGAYRVLRRRCTSCGQTMASGTLPLSPRCAKPRAACCACSCLVSVWQPPYVAFSKSSRNHCLKRAPGTGCGRVQRTGLHKQAVAASGWSARGPASQSVYNRAGWHPDLLTSAWGVQIDARRSLKGEVDYVETEEKEKVDFSELVDERQIALRARLSSSLACMRMNVFKDGMSLGKPVP